ncbi:uncharacterized protein LOC122537392 [Frieseomelitta varia]|uniref:uncharacterized protein LOC122537392 n=1 Tax=Frieseomelitta varia TaxID=561572 RepID=UPI001CB682B0|nr:uncharacterized protein LOC122537392 [Frieseomelitta varia]
MASFWFLDTLALYAIRHRRDLDEYCTSVLISWLAGEIRLLRDRKHTREDFFREMRSIFAVAADKISEQNRVPYWDEIVDEYDDSRDETEETGGESIRSSRQDDVRFSSNIDPGLVLDIVIEDTYDMYANELRYALIYAVFVEPIEIQTCDLPFTLRTPRPTKLADPKSIPFIVQLQRSLRMVGTMEKSKGNKAKGKKVKTIPEVPPTPPRSLDDEAQLMYNRSFILPLIEANESSGIFETSDA